MKKLLTALVLLAAILYTCAPEVQNLYEPATVTLDDATASRMAAQIQRETNVEVAPDLNLQLWAADSLVQDPIAISVAPDGRIFYTRASRQTSSEFDLRGHMHWAEASLSWQTVEDRRAFLRQNFAAGSQEAEDHLKDLNGDGVKDWRDLAVEKENVWVVEDRSGDGGADHASRYLVDFGEEITDVANGVAFHDGAVYVAVGPDLWKTLDQNGDGIADATESLSHGYAVHVGFSGHGMSGVKVGPLGRIWWGIGDIGSNVVDQDGKQWKNPNRGVVVRCDPDGSNFEVFAHGVRNTHEFDFDKYGNLITVDNDGDHRGERERLVYLIDGSDTGWRINWQFGKYTDPKNNDYKVWMDEGMHLPRHAGQAAYFLPPIQAFVNGPTGLVYNPGTALGPGLYDHFFVSEFRGTPARSPLHAFKMKPAGAGFALDTTRVLVEGLLPTGVDFGPDGALYFGDWINGWGTKNEGRIWKLDVGADAGAEKELREQTKSLLQSSFAGLDRPTLLTHLAHQDRRVRQKAQFTLAADGENFYPLLDFARDAGNDQLARIHALWAMAQLARTGFAFDKKSFLPFLKADDPEIIAQALKLIGDLRIRENGSQLILLLEHPSERVRFFALEALGRTETNTNGAFEAVLDLVRTNDGADIYLRHAALIALGRLATPAQLRNLAFDESREVRLVAVVALRRQQAPEIKAFLDDEDEYVVAEAARAITDDYQIRSAMSPLAQRLNARPWTNEPLVRRMIVANLNVGNDRTVDNLLTYATNKANPPAMRAEALAVLGNWAQPSVFDRVDGRYRGVRNKSDAYVKSQLGPLVPDLLANWDASLRRATVAAAAGLRLTDLTDQLVALVKRDKDATVRAAAVTALNDLKAPALEDILLRAMNDRDAQVRERALALLPQSPLAPAAAAKLYRAILESGTTGEIQSALVGLADLPGPEADALLADLLQQLKAGKIPAAARLELVEAIEARTGSPALQNALAAYDEELRKTEDLGLAIVSLTGGDRTQGRREFNNNVAGQCTRCHAVFEHGGNVGPGLAGVGSRLSPKEILTSIVRPSAALADGHETVLLTLKDEEMLSGLVIGRAPEYLEVKTGKTETRRVAYADIAEEETLPSSMPSAEGKLTRREIRDVVAYLVSLKAPDTK